jgi:hypothetical protein
LSGVAAATPDAAKPRVTGSTAGRVDAAVVDTSVSGRTAADPLRDGAAAHVAASAVRTIAAADIRRRETFPDKLPPRDPTEVCGTNPGGGSVAGVFAAEMGRTARHS